jgi:hypothetical protein
MLIVPHIAKARNSKGSRRGFQPRFALNKAAESRFYF